jgi:DNA polymerase V
MERVIGIIDLKSFYASCECSARHLDPFSTPLVCCDPYRGDSTIVMSTTPYLKAKYGIPNVCRRRDLPKVPGLIFAQPRMSYYLMMSAKVVSIFLDFVSKEDLHVYSVDESFFNLGPYLNLYHMTPEEIISRIQKKIKDKLGLIATAGIGPNMFLAKLALDNEGKKKPPYMAHWDYEDVPTKLWKISPITNIWGISTGISSHLARIGIRSVESLAKAPLDLLHKEFGVIGDQLHNLANGLDDSDIEDKYVPMEKGLSLGQTLMKDYSKEQGRLLLLEMVDKLSERLRATSCLTSKVSLWVGYSNNLGSYSIQRSLPIATSLGQDIYNSLVELYDANVSELPIRGLGISFAKLRDDDYEQCSLFVDEKEKDEQRHLDYSLDAIRRRYGPNSVLRASSLLTYSTIRMRNGQIGGHRK